MGLKEIAINAHKKEMERIHAENLQKTEAFAVQAKEILKERIGDGFTIQVISEGPDESILDVDGIKFRVTLSSEHISSVYIIKKCEECGTEYYEDLISSFGDQEKVLQNIGNILSKPHNSYDCQRALEDKERKEGKKEPTTDEKLLHALKDFVQEHAGEYVE